MTKELHMVFRESLVNEISDLERRLKKKPNDEFLEGQLYILEKTLHYYDWLNNITATTDEQ